MRNVLLILALMLTATACAVSEDSGDVPPGPAKADTQFVSDGLRLTVLYDNNAYIEGLEPAWGFSCLVSTADATVLFDCGGEAGILLSNMEKLHVDRDSIRSIVLSHEHWDHVGGITAVLDGQEDLRVYLLPSTPDKIKSEIRSRNVAMVEVTDPCKIARGIYSTGAMGTGIREQALVIRTRAGLVIITGCAHPGIVEIVTKAVDLYGGPVQFVMGGFHLIHADDATIKSIVRDFRKLGVQYVAPCHCSGERSAELFKEEYGGHFIKVGVGSVITADDLEDKAAPVEEGKDL